MYALTFDDGPGPTTGRILDLLAAAGAKATFFVLGRNIDRVGRDLVVRALREGHAVGNHSYSHSGSIHEVANFLVEIKKVDKMIRRCRREADVPEGDPIGVRLPYGAQRPDEPRLIALRGLGREPIHWTALFSDWSAGADGTEIAQQMIAHVDAQERAGPDSVLLLHDSGPEAPYQRDATAKAVELFLVEASRRGWRSKTISEIHEDLA